MNIDFRFIVAACFLMALGVGIFNLMQVSLLSKQMVAVQDSIGSLAEDQASTFAKIDVTERALVAQQEREDKRVEQVLAKSQDQLLTSAVAKIAPAVVSIVVSKDVPRLQVSYMNPFGDDPLFRDFGYQIPVWEEKGSTRERVGAGSGFLITSNGYILTNKHVVDEPGASYIVLLSTGEQKPAKVVYQDPKADVALLKVEGTYRTIASLGDSSKVKLGQTVIAIGNALGEYSNSVSVGIISGLDRTIQASDSSGNSERLNGVFQTDAPINLGNSGGPLVDINGSVIGINVATVYGSNNISFAIPIDSVKAILSNLR